MTKIGHNNPPMNPTETINKNIERKIPILDREPQIVTEKKIPLPSWIELSLIDACNRSCSFCPKSNEDLAPNTFQKMEMKLIEKLVNDLNEHNFEGAFCLCGYGEPFLHKNLIDIINKLGEVGGVEIITNGDTLDEKQILKIYESKATRLLISLYDGEKQLEKFKNMIKNTKIPEEFVILRDRWYSDKQDFGVLLTNRVGTISIGNQKKVQKKNNPCFYPSYQVLIDWNGDVFLCPQDWQRRVTMGNIMQKDFFDIWNGSVITKYRKKLLKGDRDINPCKKCNANGQVYGVKHAKAWIKKYNLT